MRKLTIFLPFRLALVAIAILQGCLPTAGGEACLKQYTMAGTVIDESSGLPIESVEIRWHYNDVNEPVIVITTTDQQGNYRYSYSTRADLAGDQIAFVKTGYVTALADPYTFSEAGPDVCGSITVTRDAVLQRSPGI